MGVLFHTGTFASCACGRRMLATSKRCRRCGDEARQKSRPPRPPVRCSCCGELKAKQARRSRAEPNEVCLDCRALWKTLPPVPSATGQGVPAGFGRDPAFHESMLRKYEVRAAAGLPLFEDAA